MKSDWLGVLVAGTAIALVGASTIPLRAGQALPLTQDSIAGHDSFQFYCASCHGTTGAGNGPTAAVLKTPPADLSSLSRRNGGTFPRERIRDTVIGIGRQVPAHGSAEMPLWGPIFKAFDGSDARVRQRVDNIVAHVETLQVPSPASADLGARLYSIHCATCHGTTAKGNGPTAASLRRPPADLTRFTARNGGVFPAERVHRIVDGREVASHGDSEMPVWGNAFRTTKDGLTSSEVKTRIDAIVRYLETIQERAAE